MKIGEAVKEDFEQIWIIFQHIVSAGETYAYPVETSKEEAFLNLDGAATQNLRLR
jgi:hypothetical protein